MEDRDNNYVLKGGVLLDSRIGVQVNQLLGRGGFRELDKQSGLPTGRYLYIIHSDTFNTRYTLLEDSKPVRIFDSGPGGFSTLYDLEGIKWTSFLEEAFHNTQCMWAPQSENFKKFNELRSCDLMCIYFKDGSSFRFKFMEFVPNGFECMIGSEIKSISLDEVKYITYFGG